MLLRIALAGVLWSVVSVHSIDAQMGDASRIERGDSLRVQLPGALWLDAQFRSWNADIMLLGVQGVAGDWPVSILDLDGLQIYGQRSPREGFRYWGLIGAASGVFVGAATGLLLHTIGVSGDAEGPTSQIISTSLRWAGLGAIAGAIAGGVYGGSHPGIGWIGVRLPGH